MISLGRWPGDPGRKPKLISQLKIQSRISTLNKTCLDQITYFSVAGTPDSDQPITVLYQSSLTTLTTATHNHVTHTTPMPGLVTCVGYNQHTAGHSNVPHTVFPTAHHGAGVRDWDTGGAGSDVTEPTRLHT